MKIACLFAIPAAVASLSGFATASDPVPVLTVGWDKPGAEVNPLLYGLMTEEINFSYDGGLYAEMVRNRVLKDDPKNPVHWSLVTEERGRGGMALDTGHPLNDALPVSLRLSVENTSGGRVGVANEGFWGMGVRPATRYRLSFYARTDAPSGGAVNVSLEKADGSKSLARAKVTGVSGEWKRYEVELETPADIKPSADNRLVLSPDASGDWHFTLVSLFPPTWKDRPNGLRPDIMRLLADMKPRFLRFPGGNYLQGNSVKERFPWKQTLGPLENRPGHPSPWGYRSSDGMGLLEFLTWCEDLNMEPLLGVYAGLSLRHKSNNHKEPVIPAGPQLEPFVQEALDQIEYVIGGTDTPWGARRAADGHPAPFKLTYVEIGNEDLFDRSKTYDARFAQFYDAIKAKYPHLKVIATIPVKGRTPDLVDLHYYRKAWEMRYHTQDNELAVVKDRKSRDFTFYHSEHVNREAEKDGSRIVLLEWATREGRPTPNMNAALGDATWMIGMERNADRVELSAYAPLFVNVNRGGSQWTPDLIGYDALNAYGSPAYYAQVMFSNNLGSRVVPVEEAGIPRENFQPPARKDGNLPPTVPLATLFSAATGDPATGTLYLKVVNLSGLPQPARIDLRGVHSVASEARLEVLSASSVEETNSISDPRRIVPRVEILRGVKPLFEHTFAPYSVNVLCLKVSAANPPTIH